MVDQAVATTASVRKAVRDLLEDSPAFRKLSSGAQQALAHSLERICAYLVEPEGIPANTLAGVIVVWPSAFQELVGAAAFPSFVAGLINGVFHAIVDSSIQQMKAFAQLLDEASKTLDRFLQENIGDDDGRDYLAETYPDVFEKTPSGALRVRDGVDVHAAVKRLSRLSGDDCLQRLDETEIKNTLIPAARRRLAASRQQLLATMVLMGINRIVVTDAKA